MSDKPVITWKDVMVSQPSWGETYKNDVKSYMRLVKRERYKYFIWFGKVMELVDTVGFLTFKDTGLVPEDL